MLLAVVLGFWTYTQATGATLTVCAKNDGDHYFIGDGFKRATCKKNEKLISWNTEGPQGEQGEKGDKGDAGPQGENGNKGDPATHGAGNIAFTCGRFDRPAFLLTDGTVWYINPENSRWTLDSGGTFNIPVPVSEVAAWCRNWLVDKSGNVWTIHIVPLDNTDGWKNLGHP